MVVGEEQPYNILSEARSGRFAPWCMVTARATSPGSGAQDLVLFFFWVDRRFKRKNKMDEIVDEC